MATKKIKAFKGLQNVSDPLRLGLGWLAQADNVDITDTGALVRRHGYSLSLAGAFTASFSTFDHQRMYVVDGGALKSIKDSTTASTLRVGLSNAPMRWAEINDQVFYNNGVDSGIILPDDEVLDWRWDMPATPVAVAVTGTLAPGVYQVRCTFVLADGRTTGASDAAEVELAQGQALSVSDIPQVTGAKTQVHIAPANSTVFQLAATTTRAALVWNAPPEELGADLLNTFFDPLPAGVREIQAWRGRLYAAQYFPDIGQSVVWFSEPLGFHLFDLNSAYFMVPGQVLMLAPHDDALIVGTDARVYAYVGDKLTQLAPYGVVPGQHFAVDQDDGKTYFWTKRGLCAAMPFANLTEKQISVSPGSHAGAAIVYHGGQKRYLACLHAGGAAFNAFPTS